MKRIDHDNFKYFVKKVFLKISYGFLNFYSILHRSSSKFTYTEKEFENIVVIGENAGNLCLLLCSERFLFFLKTYGLQTGKKDIRTFA